MQFSTYFIIFLLLLLIIIISFYYIHTVLLFGRNHKCYSGRRAGIKAYFALLWLRALLAVGNFSVSTDLHVSLQITVKLISVDIKYMVNSSLPPHHIYNTYCKYHFITVTIPTILPSSRISVRVYRLSSLITKFTGFYYTFCYYFVYVKLFLNHFAGLHTFVPH